MEIGGNIAEKIMGHGNDITDFLKTGGKVFCHSAMGFDAVSLLLVFNHRKEIELDQVIGRLVVSELTASSKESLRNKYNYAKGRIQELIDDGAVGYKSDWKWTVTGVWYDNDRLKSLRDELKGME